MTRPKGSKNAPGKRPGPKPGTGHNGRIATVKEQDREIIARLRRQGYTQREVAEELPKLGGSKLSVAMICIEERKIREAYAASKIAHREELVAEQCAALDDVINEAWKAWGVSWKETEKRVRKTFGERPCHKCPGANCPRCEGSGKYTPSAEEVLSKEGRVPGAEFLRIVLDSWKQKAQVQGVLGTGTNVNIDTRKQSVNLFDSLLSAVLGQQSAISDQPEETKDEGPAASTPQTTQTSKLPSV